MSDATKKHRRNALLAWRWTGQSAKALADSLTIEGLPYEQIPARLYASVVEFRHLRSDRRLAVCTAWLKEIVS